ncbi:MAG: TIM barrel protein [Sphingobacteriaceae bacterium]
MIDTFIKRFLVITLSLVTISLSVLSQNIKVPKRLSIGYSTGISNITSEKMSYAKSVGIDYIETSINGYIDQNTLTFKLSDEEIIKRVERAKRIADEAGIKVWSIHMPFGKTIDISLPDENDRKKVVALHKKVLQFSKILEPQIILFHPSWYLGLSEREVRKNQMVKSAIELNKEVKRIGSAMVIENMLGPELKVDAKRERPLCRTVEETVEIMNRLPGNIYSAIDMNHIGNPEKLIRAMGKRLKSVHIADGTGRQENHYLPCSGKGKNNWNEILTALNEVGYTGPFLFESSSNDLKDYKDCYDELYNRTFVSRTSQESHFASTDSILISKLFPLLHLFKYDKQTLDALQNDKSLSSIQLKYNTRVKEALQKCKEVTCYADSLKWKTEEIRVLGDKLIGFYQTNKLFREKISELKTTGLYALYDNAADTTLLRSAWNLDLSGLNRVFDIYIKGERPRYYKIDSISYKPRDADFKRLMYTTLNELTKQKERSSSFDLSLKVATHTLRLNGRDEAVRFVPLSSGMNKLPYSKISSINWDKYAYSVILIPGKGPEVPYVKLDPDAIKRCNDGVERFRKGLAPFIVVSGGNVHPFKTPHNEAVEMKKYLVEELKIPEDVVFIEPDARHTTTNLRNTSRIVYRFGIPSNKPILIVTDKSQSSFITGAMSKTAMRDLGYLPFKDMKKLSEQETEFYPTWNSLQADNVDPLDP